MKLIAKLLTFLGFIFFLSFLPVLLIISLFSRRVRSEVRSLKRQIPEWLMYGWPKFIIVASKPDADACAAPMAFLLAKNLTEYQVWWRQVRAGEEHTPRGLEHFIPRIHFDTGCKFDGKLVDGKLVKPGKLYFDHHHDRSFLNHCATSLVVESFGLKDHVLNFLGEYVRLIDTGNPGAANQLLSRYSQTRANENFNSIITLHRFFETMGTTEMLSVIENVGKAIHNLRYILRGLSDYQPYGDYFQALNECEIFWQTFCADETICADKWDKVTKTVMSAKAAAKAIVAKFVDPEPGVDGELYLNVYGIEKSNAGILRNFSSIVASFKKNMPNSEKLRVGSIVVGNFYNAETGRRQIMRQLLPGGGFRRLEVKTPSGSTVSILTAENCAHLGNKMRTTIRQFDYDAFDLIICDSPNGQIGVTLVDEQRREVLKMRQFRDVLAERYPAHAESFLPPNENLVYIKTVKDAKAKDKISFTEVVALARELIEYSSPKAELPIVSKAELPPFAEVRPNSAPKALTPTTEAMA